jgi:hypothetical protein
MFSMFSMYLGMPKVAYERGEKSANSGGFGTGLDETPRDEDSEAFLGEGLVASDGSHLGSISGHSLDPESIGDPPEDKFID